MFTQVQAMIHFTLPNAELAWPLDRLSAGSVQNHPCGQCLPLRGGTLSGELHTDPLLSLHVTVGYLWSHTRSWHSIAGGHDKAGQSFAPFRFRNRTSNIFMKKISDVFHPHHISVAKMGQNGAQILEKDMQMLALPLWGGACSRIEPFGCRLMLLPIQ